jgi:hypothetical protein
MQFDFFMFDFFMFDFFMFDFFMFDPIRWSVAVSCIYCRCESLKCHTSLDNRSYPRYKRSKPKPGAQ